MDPRPESLESSLQNDLNLLLRDGAEQKPPRASVPLDVLVAYRVLLARWPESLSAEWLTERARQLPTTDLLLRGIIGSPEFRDRYFGKCERAEGRTVIVPLGDLRIAVDLDDLGVAWPVVNGSYEPEIVELVQELVQPGDLCVDVGANVGYITAIMARCAGADGAVLAYEPFPRVYRLLEQTVRESGLSGVVTPRAAACGERADAAVLHFPVYGDHLAGSFVASSAAPGAGMGSAEIQTVTLDEELAGEGKQLRVMKVDAEGSEIEALLGAAQRIVSDRPAIILEVCDSALRRGGHSEGELVELVRSMNYELFPAQALLRGPRAALAPDHKFGEWENLLCLPMENLS